MTEALTPAGCDLSDFPFMPLDVARLRDSELASNETPEACWAAVLLWAASWHQVPAASIPDDEKWIAKAAGYAQRGKIDKAWSDVRPGAMRGWVKCDDGRWYHPVVAEKARDAWQAKLEQRYRTECGRIKKHNDRHEGANVPKPTFDEWVSQGCPTGQPLPVPRDSGGSGEDSSGDRASKRQGEGQGQGDSYSEANASAAGAAPGKSDAPPDPKSPEELAKVELWRAGRALLLEADVPKAQCGTFLGALVTQHGALLVVEAVRAAVKEIPADPREYLKATCLHLAGQRKHLNRQEAIEATNRKVASEWAAEGETA